MSKPCASGGDWYRNALSAHRPTYLEPGDDSEARGIVVVECLSDQLLVKVVAPNDGDVEHGLPVPV